MLRAFGPTDSPTEQRNPGRSTLINASSELQWRSVDGVPLYFLEPGDSR